VTRDGARAAGDRNGGYGSADPDRAAGLVEIERPRFRYRKTGILLLGPMPAESVQGSLYQQQDDRRRVGLMSVIDAINRRYGRDRIQFASAGLD
jgi:DNA polymerase V